MIAVYLLPGVAASIALVIYVGLVSVTLNAFEVTLTLPGLAGIILGIGMAVDANVIIFERIKEELHTCKTLRVSVEAGFKKAFATIFDSNITTIIVGACLLQFGTGPVKGFAVTLIIGLLVSLFTAVFVTRAIYELILTSNTKEISL